MSKKEDGQNISPFAQYKKERQRKKKIADVFSVVIIFFSFLCSIVYVVEEYGKDIAFWYFFLWIWAMEHAISSND